jgi:hypothetical protein
MPFQEVRTAKKTNSQTKSNKMQKCIKILFHIYMKLNISGELLAV